MINYGVYGDLEVGIKDGALESDLGLSSLEAYLKETRRPVEDMPLLGWFYGKLVKKQVHLPGDFLSKELQLDYKNNALSIYQKLIDNESLDKTLSDYRSEFKSFDKASFEDNLGKLYADLCFRPELCATGGVYLKVFDKLEKLAKKYNVDFTFVLGNNDLDFKLFKPRYDSFKSIKRVNFVDGVVKEVNGKLVAGLGGCTEIPGGVLGELGFVSNTHMDEIKARKDALVNACDGLYIDSLVCHKAYDNPGPDAKLKYGSFNPNPWPEFLPFVNEVISDLVKKININVKTKLFCGHWHEELQGGGACFDLGKDSFFNPGKREVVSWSFMDGLGLPKKAEVAV